MKSRILSLSFFVTFIICLAVAYTNAQQNNETQSKIRAQEIMKSAREAIRLKTTPSKLLSIYISFEGLRDEGVELPERNELEVTLHDKIRYSSVIETKVAKAILVKKLSDDHYKMEVNNLHSRLGISSSAKTASGKEDVNIKNLRLETSEMLLPFVVDFLFMPLEFKYIGVAESDIGKAYVLEAKTADKEQYQLLFDQKSHLLVMMVKSFTNDEEKAVEHRFYYTEYKENNGMLIPHKVTIEGQGEKYFVERKLTGFKINPEFTPDTFEIKDK